MNREDFFTLISPQSPPKVPEYISFSFLNKWEECPRRVFLEGGGYGQFPNGKYPLVVLVPQLEGTLIHATIEHLINSAKENPGGSRTEVIEKSSPRQFVKARLGQLKEELRANPRVDATDLISKISVDKVVNVSKGWFLSRAEYRGSSKSSEGSRYSAEAWITIENPPLRGILDLIVGEEIVDFKTGAPSEAHSGQMRFYALLWFLKYGEPPKKLTLIYSQTDTHVDVPVPGVRDLESARVQADTTVKSIKQTFETCAFEAKPEPEKCQWCAVRQLCDPYWKGSTHSKRSDNDFVDIQHTFEPSVTIDRNQGFNLRTTDLSLTIDRARLPRHGSKVKQVRILNAAIKADNPSEARLLKFSEVYWSLC